MSKNNINVNVIADGMAVWTAILGTALPTTLPPTNPGAAYDEVGLLTAAGITEGHNMNETKIYDSLGSLVRIARNQEERPWTFSALEGNNVVDSLRFPGTSVVNTGSTAEVQTVTITGTPTGGTFGLTSAQFGAATNLAYNIATTALVTALQAAWGVTVTVTGTAGSSYIITFPAIGGNVSQLTPSNNLTGGTTPSISVATTTPGVTGVNSRGVGSGTGRNLRSFVIDLVDGTMHKRIGMNNAEAVWTGTTTYSGAAAAEYQFTIQPYKDSNGLYYVILDDNTADAELFV